MKSPVRHGSHRRFKGMTVVAEDGCWRRLFDTLESTGVTQEFMTAVFLEVSRISQRPKRKKSKEPVARSSWELV